THIRLEGPRRNRIREVVITGDFFVTPPRTIYDLEAALRGTEIEDQAVTISDFFDKAGVGLLTASPEDFSASISNAVK
ncbi:MAG: hypothetical protein ACR2PF_05455, partial [Rhizobiaceae bacterium]